WSRGNSPLHRRDPRAKLIALLVFLVVVATARHHLVELSLALFAVLFAAVVAAGLPLISALARAGVVVPFTTIFALISWMSGDPSRGGELLLKSYLSALAVLVVVSTTPLPI